MTEDPSAAARVAGLLRDGPPKKPFLGRTKVIVGILSSIISAAAGYQAWPSLKVEPLQAMASSGPLDAKFTFTNTGLIDISDVKFSCRINAKNARNLFLAGVMLSDPIVGSRGQNAVCGTSTYNSLLEKFPTSSLR